MSDKTMRERAHERMDEVLDSIAQQAQREPMLTETTFDDYLRGTTAWSGLGGLRSALVCHYLDSRDATKRAVANPFPPSLPGITRSE